MDGLLLEIHLEEMVTLRAREALHDATVTALGAGRMKANDANRVRRAWLREAGFERTAKIKDKDQMRSVLGAVGVGFRG